MAEVTERSVPVACDSCSADMTVRITRFDDVHRRFEMFCSACGAVFESKNQVLEQVRVGACGPHGQSEVVVGNFWGDEP